jgi:hypothetical protein
MCQGLCSESVNGDCLSTTRSVLESARPWRSQVCISLIQSCLPHTISSLPTSLDAPQPAAGMANFKGGEFVANCSAFGYHLTPSILPFSAFASPFLIPASNRLVGLTELYWFLIPAAVRGTNLEYEQEDAAGGRRVFLLPHLLLESPPSPEVSIPQAGLGSLVDLHKSTVAPKSMLWFYLAIPP